MQGCTLACQQDTAYRRHMSWVRVAPVSEGALVPVLAVELVLVLAAELVLALAMELVLHGNTMVWHCGVMPLANNNLFLRNCLG